MILMCTQTYAVFHTYIALSILDTNSYTTILCLFRLLYIAFWPQYPGLEEGGGGGYNMDTLSSQMVQSESVTSMASGPWFSTKLVFNPVSLSSDSANSLFEGRQQKIV